MQYRVKFERNPLVNKPAIGKYNFIPGVMPLYITRAKISTCPEHSQHESEPIIEDRIKIDPVVFEIYLIMLVNKAVKRDPRSNTRSWRKSAAP